MAEKRFTLNTAPHVAEIGDDIVLEFQPEVDGDAFMDAYEHLRNQYKSLGIGDQLNDVSAAAATNVDTSKLRRVTGALREFLAELMMPTSAKQFVSWDVVDEKKKVVKSFTSQDEAEEYARQKEHLEEDGSPRVVDNGMKLPNRVMVELMQWAVELYGGRPTGLSSDSSLGSSTAGRPSTERSRSKGSTRTAGR